MEHYGGGLDVVLTGHRVTTILGEHAISIGQVVQEIKSGKVEFRVDRAGIVHVGIGRVSFELDALQENATALLETLTRVKPATSKGKYMKGIALSSTMGPGIKVDEVAMANALR